MIQDPAAAIAQIINLFILNCQNSYTIGNYAGVDDMFVSFRGRCKFRMYMRNKPDKCGLKIMW